MGSAVQKLQHEDFEVIKNDLDRPTVIRPDRIYVEAENCFLEIMNKSYKAVNLSSFGLAILSNSDSVGVDEVQNSILIYENTEVANLHIKKIRTKKVSASEYELGFEILGEPLSIERVYGLKAAFSIIEEQNQLQNDSQNVPEVFRKTVYEMKNWLENLDFNLREIENKSNENSYLEINDFNQTVSLVISNYLSESFQPIYQQLSGSLKGLSPEHLQESFDFFRDNMNSLIFQAPFADRVFNKPLGYAGDYEMMNIIYNNNIIGKSLFAKCLHRYFVEQPAASAVRNRSEYLLRQIKHVLDNTSADKTLKLLSVASGPAKEIQMFLADCEQYKDRKIEFNFVDQDLNALKHAQNKLRALQLRHGTQFEINFNHMAIKNIIASGLPEVGFDLIYSAGLYDYLSEPVAKITSKKLFDGLSEKGQLIVGNFSVSNPNQFTMNLALDWHLIYRTKDHFKQLFELLNRDVRVDEEELGINLFAVVEK